MNGMCAETGMRTNFTRRLHTRLQTRSRPSAPALHSHLASCRPQRLFPSRPHRAGESGIKPSCECVHARYCHAPGAKPRAALSVHQPVHPMGARPAIDVLAPGAGPGHCHPRPVLGGLLPRSCNATAPTNESVDGLGMRRARITTQNTPMHVWFPSDAPRRSMSRGTTTARPLGRHQGGCQEEAPSRSLATLGAEGSELDHISLRPPNLRHETLWF